MGKLTYTLIALLSFLLCSCSEKKNVPICEENISAQAVIVDPANRKIWPKFLYGDILCAWKIDYYGGKLTKNEWQKADSMFVAGHGHNEFGLILLSQDNSGSLYLLNHPMMGDKLVSLTRISHANSFVEIKNEDNWERFNLKELPPIYCDGENFVVLSDSSILVAGAPIKDMEHVFSVIDFKNQRIKPLNYWPDDGSKCSDFAKHRIYAGHCILLGNGKGRFLYKNEYCKQAFIFSIDGTAVNVHKDLYSETLDYSAGSTKFDFVINKKSTERLACCCDAENIYLLCRDSDSKGNKLDKYKDPFIFGNRIEVYDWDGVMKKIIHLDKYGQNIMLSADGHTIFLFSDYSDETPEPKIYSYDLNKNNP